MPAAETIELPNTTDIVRPAAPPPALLTPIAKPAQVMEAHKAAVEVIKSCLEEGRDYGKIPGTDDKNNLLKPGAERLAGAYGLRPEFEIVEQEVDHDRPNDYRLTKWVTRPKPANADELKAQGIGRNKKFGERWSWQEREEELGTSLGLYRYVLRCRLFEPGGREVGQGVGACSSLETKYIRAPRDAENTVFKMAKKRAFVDAILTTLGLSDRFTQDLEDMQANEEAAHDAPAEEPAKAPGCWLTLERPPSAKENAAADAYMREVGFNKESFGRLKAAAAAIRLDPRFAILEGKRLGLKDPEAIIGLLEAEEPAIEAELVEEQDPKAGASSPAGPADAAPSAGPSSEASQRTGQPGTTEEAPADNPQGAYWRLHAELGWPKHDDDLAELKAINYEAWGELLGSEVKSARSLTKAFWKRLVRELEAIKAGTKREPAAIASWREDPYA